MLFTEKQIVRMYTKDQMSCRDISAKDGRSEATIYKILKDNDVELRSRSEANKIFPDNAIIRLYNLGLSCTQIGRLLGLDPSTITKRLHLLGFPMRNRNLAAAIRYSEEEFKRHFFNSEFLKVLENELC